MAFESQRDEWNRKMLQCFQMLKKKNDEEFFFRNNQLLAGIGITQIKFTLKC